MAAGGGERITLSLLSMPRLTVRACLAALPAVMKHRIHEEVYRAYVTDALRILGENTAKYAGGGYIQMRFIDLIDRKPNETRTSAEIVDTIRAKLRRIGGD